MHEYTYYEMHQLFIGGDKQDEIYEDSLITIIGKKLLADVTNGLPVDTYTVSMTLLDYGDNESCDGGGYKLHVRKVTVGPDPDPVSSCDVVIPVPFCFMLFTTDQIIFILDMIHFKLHESPFFPYTTW